MRDFFLLKTVFFGVFVDLSSFFFDFMQTLYKICHLWSFFPTYSKDFLSEKRFLWRFSRSFKYFFYFFCKPFAKYLICDPSFLYIPMIFCLFWFILGYPLSMSLVLDVCQVIQCFLCMAYLDFIWFFFSNSSCLTTRILWSLFSPC